MKTVWFDGFPSSNKQRKKNRLKCKSGLMNDGTKDREKTKYIITLWVFVFFWCKMAGKTHWTDHKMKIQNILYFYNYKRHNTHLPPPK